MSNAHQCNSSRNSVDRNMIVVVNLVNLDNMVRVSSTQVGKRLVWEGHIILEAQTSNLHDFHDNSTMPLSIVQTSK